MLLLNRIRQMFCRNNPLLAMPRQTQIHSSVVSLPIVSNNNNRNSSIDFIRPKFSSRFAINTHTSGCNINSRSFTKAAMTDSKEPDFNKENPVDALFELTYNQILSDFSVDHSHISQLEEVRLWLQKAVEYNLSNGKRNRAKSLVSTFKLLAPDFDTESVQEACMLGWCVELLQAYFLMVDDVMDNSITRRGQLCWYRMENVGLTAINDAIMVNNSIYFLLQKYFGSHSCYTKIVDLFNEITKNTAYGQCLDLISNPTSKIPDLSKYTDDRYDTIVRYKTSYYSFCLPIRLAMYLANINDPETHLEAEKILIKIGHLFQVQDDYLDCYGDPNVTGKIGTDIEDAKCSWLIVNALKTANDEQKKVIMDNYGVKSEEAVDNIKSIYKELEIEELFKVYEKREFNKICCLIEQIDGITLSKDVFYNFLSMIYKRDK